MTAVPDQVAGAVDATSVPIDARPLPLRAPVRRHVLAASGDRVEAEEPARDTSELRPERPAEEAS